MEACRPSQPLDNCIKRSQIRQGWGRGGDCRSLKDCPAACRCFQGFCIAATAEKTDASDEEIPEGLGDEVEEEFGDEIAPDKESQESAENVSNDSAPETLAGKKEAWVKALIASEGVEIRSLVTTPDKKLVVFGHFQGSLSEHLLQTQGKHRDLFVWVLTEQGETLWSKRFGGELEEQAHQIVVDRQGSLYFMFQTTSATIKLGQETFERMGASDVLIVKMSLNGKVLWAKNVGGDKDESPGALAISKSGKIFFGTNIFSPKPAIPFASHCSFGQLDASGKLLWKFDPWTTHPKCALYAMTPHPNGGVLLSGHFFIDGPGLQTKRGERLFSINNGLDLFLAHYDDSGSLQWAESAGTIEADYRSIVSVRSASDGSIYWASNFANTMLYFSTGHTLRGASGRNAFVAKFTPGGDLRWVRRLSGGTDTVVTVKNLRTTLQGHVLVLGDFWGNLQFSEQTNLGLSSSSKLPNTRDFTKYDLFLAQLNPDGVWLNARGLGTPGAENSGQSAQALDGTLYWSGTYQAKDLVLDGHPLPDTTQLQGWLWKLAPWP